MTLGLQRPPCSSSRPGATEARRAILGANGGRLCSSTQIRPGPNHTAGQSDRDTASKQCGQCEVFDINRRCLVTVGIEIKMVFDYFLVWCRVNWTIAVA